MRHAAEHYGFVLDDNPHDAALLPVAALPDDQLRAAPGVLAAPLWDSLLGPPQRPAHLGSHVMWPWVRLLLASKHFPLVTQRHLTDLKALSNQLLQASETMCLPSHCF